MTSSDRAMRRLAIWGAAGLALWALATWAWVMWAGQGNVLVRLFLTRQDMPVLLVGVAALLLAALTIRPGQRVVTPKRQWIAVIIVALTLIAWVGHYLIFRDYAFSRDEEMASFAAAYMRAGHLGMAIPPEWLPFRNGMVPIFTNPVGGTVAWVSAYLPVNAGAQALMGMLGDPNLASPLFLAIGLVSLWSAARSLFPDRTDMQWVVMLLALSSAQLTTMAMTPYAMSGHFALDMAWLALVLRRQWWSHVAAGVVAIVAMGLHQLHFTPLFAAPFILWFLLRRRWAVVLFHAAVFAAGFILWSKYYPALLRDLFDTGQAVAVAAKATGEANLTQRIARFGERIQALAPMPSLMRFVAWNNLLLMPLALVGAWGLKRRALWTSADPVMPLVLGCAIGLTLTLYQVHGWGYRYLHGQIGAFCLLGAYGWRRLAGEGGMSLRPMWIASGIAAAMTAFLWVTSAQIVAPYVDAHAEARRADADVVLVDTRGGLFAQDIVRFDDARITRPVLMDLSGLSMKGLDELCRTRSVAIADQALFARHGMPAVNPAYRGSERFAKRREHLAAIGCGRVI